jgi:hypothetical protein
MSESNQLRIILSSEASARLTALGERTFAVATRQTFPGDPARWVLYLRAVDTEIVEGALRVLSGELQACPFPNEK